MRIGQDRKHQPERGAILVLTALLLVVLVGMAALAVDAANAWSTKRLAQNNADMATLSAVAMIPRTFQDGGPAPTINIGAQGAGSAVQQEVMRITGINGCTAPCDPTSDVTLVGGEYFLEVDVDTASRNAFGQAIGGGATVDLSASATAKITPRYPQLPVMPIGFNIAGGNPFRCVTNDDPAPSCSPDGDLLGIRTPFSSPACQLAQPTTIHNIREGLGFLVDTVGDRGSSEYDCVHYHELTMPTTARRPVNDILVPVIEDGLVNDRLVGDVTRLWQYVAPGPGCDPALMDAAADIGDWNLASELMSICLGGAPEFNFTGGDWTQRLTWGIDTAAADDVTYEGYRPIWLHTYIDPDGVESIDPPPTISGFTFFILDQGRIRPEVLVEHDPGGLDNLDFELVD